MRKERVGGGGGGVFKLFKQDVPLLKKPSLLGEAEMIWACHTASGPPRPSTAILLP